MAENMAWVVGKKGVGRQKERCRMLDDLAVDVFCEGIRGKTRGRTNCFGTPSYIGYIRIESIGFLNRIPLRICRQ